MVSRRWKLIGVDPQMVLDVAHYVGTTNLPPDAEVDAAFVEPLSGRILLRCESEAWPPVPEGCHLEVIQCVVTKHG